MERRPGLGFLVCVGLSVTLGCSSSSVRPYAGGVSMSSAVVRYQISDVTRAIAFYERLGFKLEQQTPGVFAAVRRGDLRLLLSGPGSSGSRPMPDGRKQEPGGWNRIVLDVSDLASEIERHRAAGVRFRNDVETGPGGKQIQLEDPDGNPIELHEPRR